MLTLSSVFPPAPVAGPTDINTSPGNTSNIERHSMNSFLRKIFRQENASLYGALSNQDLATFRRLLEEGSDPDELDLHGQTPLFFVVYNKNEKQIDFLNLLISFGATIDFQKDDGTTPLFFARKEVAKILLENGSNINVKAKKGNQPIHFAMDLETAALFLEWGADINAKDFDNATPLHHYVYFGSDLVEFAIKSGADVNAKEVSFGWTPLISLCRTAGFNDEENVEIIKTAKILLNAGADINWKDNDGMTAYDNALDTDVNNIELASFLKSHMKEVM